jgi:lysophospholipase L1-like esterase
MRKEDQIMEAKRRKQNPNGLKMYWCLALMCLCIQHLVAGLDAPHVYQGKEVEFAYSLEDGVMSLSAQAKGPKIRRAAFVSVPCSEFDGDVHHSTGVSFEVKGKVSDGLASCFIGDNKKLMAVHGYEHGFLLEASWTKMTLYWEDFVQNQKPWGSKEHQLLSEHHRPSVKDLSQLAFGRMFKYNRHDRKDWSLEIKNIKWLSTPKADVSHLLVPPKNNLEKSLAKIRSGEELNVLLVGDSITDYGKDRAHGFFVFEELKKDHPVKVTIHNGAIGGHSVRCGTVVLKRSLKAMPKPDLVIMMYGANDCKALESKSMGPKDFNAQMGFFIDRLREWSESQPDIVIMNGVPRLNKERKESTGLVEKATAQIRELETSHGVDVIETQSHFLALDDATRLKVYKDTIHQTEEGQIFLAQYILQHFKEKL